jgi:Uma2 family endonuclease
MSTIIPPHAPFGFGAPDMPPEPVMRLSVDQYLEMVDTGIIQEDDPVELLEGWLVPKMTKNPDHWICVTLIRDALTRMSIAGFFVHSQDPVRTEDSVPEPDVALVRGKPRDYRGGNPQPEHLTLVVEVADTSLRRDRTIKKRVYARAGVPVYWIVNLKDREIEIHTQPSGPSKKPVYKSSKSVSIDGEMPVVVNGRKVGSLKVVDLLP